MKLSELEVMLIKSGNFTLAGALGISIAIREYLKSPPPPGTGTLYHDALAAAFQEITIDPPMRG